MKKRILAIVLACLMLASVLPTSAFAAEHEHAEYLCPGVGEEHIKGADYCNFDYDPAKAVVVESVCDEIGYTLYQCLGCGEHVAADTNYGEDGIGSHKYGELHAAVAPNCGEKKHGTIAYYYCADCKNYFDENKVKLGKDESVIVWKYTHDFAANEGDEVDCTKDGLVCKDCGYEAPACDEHNWGKAEMFLWPTTTEDGRAIEFCQNEGCTQYRLVLIEKQCMHSVDSLTKVEAKPATCTEGGWNEHYICAECSEAAGKTVYLMANKVGQVATVPEDLVNSMVMIAKLGHDYGTNPVETVKTECHKDGSVTLGYTYQHCNRCNLDIKIKDLTGGHNMVQYDKKNPTCTEWGADYNLCTVCGYLETKLLEPLGHNSYKDGINQKERPATCTTPGKREWDCGRKTEVYDEDGNFDGYYTCNYHDEEILPVVKHNQVTLQLDQSCKSAGWILTYCTYADCAGYDLVTEVQGIALTTLIAQYNAAKRTSITVPAEGWHVSGFVVLNKFDCGHTPIEHDETCLKYHNWDSTLLNQPTCTKPGSIGHICADCKAYWHEEIKPDGQGHNMTYDKTKGDYTVPATCAEPGKKVTYCKGYIKYDAEGKPTTTVVACAEGHYTEEEIPVITMDEINHIYDWSEVVNVGTAAAPVYMPLIMTIHTHLPYTTYTENGATYYSMTSDYAEKVEGNCETLSIHYIWCDDCHRGLFITDGISGEGKHQIDKENGYTAAVPAGCWTSGWTEKGYCKICGSEMPGELIPAKHNNPANIKHVEAKPIVCGQEGYAEHWYCECEGYKKYYSGAEAKESQLLTEAEHEAMHITLQHNYVEHCYQYMDCEQFGYVHMICQNPGCPHGTVAPDGTDKEGYVGVLLEVIRARGHWLIDATCEVAEHCGHKGCTYEIEGLEPALGHKNAAGEMLSRDCLLDAGAKDRVCVNGKRCDCWAYDAELKEYVAVVNVEHDWYDDLIHVDPSCKEYECDIRVCKKCALNEKINQGDKDPDGHKWIYENGKPSYTNATKGTCLLCGKVEYFALTGVQFTASASNAVAGINGFVDSSLVKLNITIESIKKVGIHTFRFDVNYDADNMYYVGFERIFDDLFANVSDVLDVMVHDNGEGTVTCLFVADNDDEGNLQNIIVEKLELINLFFRIDLTEENNAPSKMYGDATNTFNFTIENVEVLDADKKALTANDPDYGFGVTNAKINVEALGDTDNTGGRELSDVQRAYELFITDGYHIGADINQNGVIDMEDILMAYQYAIDAIDYDDLWYCGVDD